MTANFWMFPFFLSILKCFQQHTPKKIKRPKVEKKSKTHIISIQVQLLHFRKGTSSLINLTTIT